MWEYWNYRFFSKNPFNYIEPEAVEAVEGRR
jgi:hypothetical protein